MLKKVRNAIKSACARRATACFVGDDGGKILPGYRKEPDLNYVSYTDWLVTKKEQQDRAERENREYQERRDK